MRSPFVVGGVAALVVAIGAGIGWLTLGTSRPPAAVGPSSLPSAIALNFPSASSDTDLANASAPPAEPTATVKPSPKPTPKPAATWSKPVLVGGRDECFGVAAAIDDRGTNHLATACKAGIRYATSSPGASWTVEDFKPPIHTLDQDPQLAFDGGKLYLAWTRLAPTDGGCGGDGLVEVGVFYRVRTLPNGKWSGATRIGPTHDHIQSLRVKDSIQATVLNDKDGKTYFETLAGSTYHRYPIADAAGLTSLRVGSDGRARIAYENAAGSIALATFNGSGLSAATIPRTEGGWAPALALGNGNAAYLMWNRSYHGLGCAEPGPDPADGTYFGTNVSGAWVSSRVTKAVGGGSFALNADTGEVQAVIRTGTGLTYYARAADGPWRSSTLVRTYAATPVIRANPSSGALLVGYIGSDSVGRSALYAMTKG